MAVSQGLYLIQSKSFLLNLKGQPAEILVQLAKPLLILLTECKVVARVAILLLPEILDLLIDSLDSLPILASKVAIVLLLGLSCLELAIELKPGEVLLLVSLFMMI